MLYAFTTIFPPGLSHVDTVFALVGGHLGGGVVNERPGTANIRVQLAPAGGRDLSAGQWVALAQRELDNLDLPGARIGMCPPAIRGLRCGVTGADLSVSVVGDELDTMHRIAREITARLGGIPGLEGVEVGREDQSPLLRVRVDREPAADFGLRTSDIGRAVREAVDGAVPTRYLVVGHEYDVRVRLPAAAVSDSGTLGELLLSHDDGVAVLLRDVARFELGEGPAHIEHENQNRVVRVNGDINTQVPDVGSIMAEVDRRLAGLALPEQYSLIYRDRPAPARPHPLRCHRRGRRPAPAPDPDGHLHHGARHDSPRHRHRRGCGDHAPPGSDRGRGSRRLHVPDPAGGALPVPHSQRRGHAGRGLDDGARPWPMPRVKRHYVPGLPKAGATDAVAHARAARER